MPPSEWIPSFTVYAVAFQACSLKVDRVLRTRWRKGRHLAGDSRAHSRACHHPGSALAPTPFGGRRPPLPSQGDGSNWSRGLTHEPTPPSLRSGTPPEEGISGRPSRPGWYIRDPLLRRGTRRRRGGWVPWFTLCATFPTPNSPHPHLSAESPCTPLIFVIIFAHFRSHSIKHEQQ